MEALILLVFFAFRRKYSYLTLLTALIEGAKPFTSALEPARSKTGVNFIVLFLISVWNEKIGV